MDNAFFNNEDFLAVSFLLTLLLPLASGILSFLTPERYSWLTILNAPLLLLFSAVFAIIVFFNCGDNPSAIVNIPWIHAGETQISANLFLSNTSILMMAVVAIISFLVHFYSVGYMAGDEGAKKYFGVLGFFTFAMHGVILADNLLLLFVFWELVGFSSYLLIGHFNDQAKAGKAASKAFMMNRIGDASLLIGILIVGSQTGSFEISTALSTTPFELKTVAGICILGGVIGKSAQFPLFTWLPDAMAGPTPVSALIHAATMVAAGIYLLIRVFPIFTESALMLISVIGGITAASGALAALFQHDIKKVLAYSTISQLGVMVMAIGAGAVSAALLHLITHAFFKACLFLCAGSVIHAMHRAQSRNRNHFDVQDISNLGGLRKKLPVTFLCFAFSAASLAGLPFFSGFLSKEAIYTALLTESKLGWTMFVVMASTSFMTVLYIFRLFWLVFMGESRKTTAIEIQESPVVMKLPMVILGIASLWLVVSWNPFNFSGYLIPQNEYQHLNWLTFFSIVLTSAALAVGYWALRKPRLARKPFFENAFGLDTVYRIAVEQNVHRAASFVEFTDQKILDGAIHVSAYGHVTLAHVLAWGDKYIIDGSVRFFAGIIRWLGGIARSYQTGKIQDYIFYAILALIIFLIWTL